ncbi:MAG: sugar transferase [Acidobacteriaceae bacterium]|nr:sugar transferase [Acidobacteriaceae bacterium]
MRYPSLGEHAKRAFDFTVALVMLLVCLPVMAVVALAVGVTMGRPILFRQQRPGCAARPFTLLKFRTMIVSKSSLIDPSTDAARLTKIGILLRRASLDELPQLWNVLKGEMSLIGPRPLLMEYLPLYTDEQAERHRVRPGLTGLAQVNGRNAIAWEQKLQLDTWYVRHWSFGLDLRILLVTMGKVLRREGISHRGHVTMEKFGKKFGAEPR